MLHTKTPAELFGRQLGDVGIASASRAEPRGGKLGVTNGCGKSYPSWMTTDKPAETAKLTYDLISSVRARERVNLVDYHELKSVE